MSWPASSAAVANALSTARSGQRHLRAMHLPFRGQGLASDTTLRSLAHRPGDRLSHPTDDFEEVLDCYVTRFARRPLRDLQETSSTVAAVGARHTLGNESALGDGLPPGLSSSIRRGRQPVQAGPGGPHVLYFRASAHAAGGARGHNRCAALTQLILDGSVSPDA